MNIISTQPVDSRQKFLSTPRNEQEENALIEQALSILYARLRKKGNIAFTESSR